MKPADDGADNVGARATDPPRRGWVPAASTSIALGLLLGILVTVALYSFVTTTPLALRIRWWHALILVELSAIAVAAVSYWSITRRRLWFVCFLPILGWMILTLFLIQSFTPFDNYQRFILDCATISRSETIDAFDGRMTKRGWQRFDRTWEEPPEGQGILRFSEGGGEAFIVHFDTRTREIVRWRFLHD